MANKNIRLNNKSKKNTNKNNNKRKKNTNKNKKYNRRINNTIYHNGGGNMISGDISAIVAHSAGSYAFNAYQLMDETNNFFNEIPPNLTPESVIVVNGLRLNILDFNKRINLMIKSIQKIHIKHEKFNDFISKCKALIKANNENQYNGNNVVTLNNNVTDAESAYLIAKTESDAAYENANQPSAYQSVDNTNAYNSNDNDINLISVDYVYNLSLQQAWVMSRYSMLNADRAFWDWVVGNKEESEVNINIMNEALTIINR